jgi:hypothetical protein
VIDLTLQTKPTKRQAVERILEEMEESALLMKGYDEAIIGLTDPLPGEAIRVVYDRAKVIAIIAKNMNFAAAVEYFNFEVVSGWSGESSPVFIDLI